MSAKKAKNDQAEEVETAELNEAEMMEAEEESLYKAEDAVSEQLRVAEKKAEENWELLLRTKAEMDNLRRRTQIDLENAHKFALEKFVQELLPIMDSMELGLASENVDAKALREGMELTLNMLRSAFGKFKVEAIDPVNQKFDPELHQAMATQPSDELDPNTVMSVMQKGYTLNGRLVRPAMVMVSKASE
jgi:molecular chaperone GrpE